MTNVGFGEALLNNVETLANEQEISANDFEEIKQTIFAETDVTKVNKVLREKLNGELKIIP